MVQELAWYLESGRFSSLVEELEGSLRKYEAAKKGGRDESTLSLLRENARSLFEDHCVRSGLRESEASFINIDVEFFDGNILDETAVNAFMKNIIKNHCYQKVLWTYMGTTGLLSPISKTEMAKAGLRHEDYLPLEHKTKRHAKKPFEQSMGKSTELFYLYGDGTASREYDPGKAKVKFNRLEDTSGVDWKAGYDPNGTVQKNGWHGKYDHSGTWVRVEDKEAKRDPAGKEGTASIELIRNGDTAILHDPGMAMLSSPLLVYATELGEPYGSLAMDREATVDTIREMLETMGVSGIGAIGGIDSENPELIVAYREVLRELAAPSLEAMDTKAVQTIKEAHEKETAERAAEDAGVRLERKLSKTGRYGVDAAVPLSPRKAGDSRILGLSEEEAREVGAMSVSPDHEREYDTVLSNLYAAWAYYEGGGLSKAEAAALVNKYLEGNKDDLPAITAQASLGEIIRGGGETVGDGATIYSSGIPGIFAEPPAVDFYNEGTREKYLKSLERKRVLPKGGSAVAMTTLQKMPEGSEEQKARLNRGLTRALGQYKAISMSMGMPLGELIATVKAEAGFGEGKGPAVLGKMVYYELPMETVIREAKKENLQKKEARLEEEDGDTGGKTEIIIGGVSGPALDEVVFTRERLTAGGMSEKEAEKAQPFLHSIRFTSESPVVPAYLLEAFDNSKATSAEELEQGILGVLDAHEGAAYNLSSNGGMQAYFEGSRAREAKINKRDVQTLVQEELRKPQQVPVPSSHVSKVEPRYKAEGGVTLQSRSAPKGTPEKIRLVGTGSESEEAYETGSNAGPDVAEFGGFTEEVLEQEYGYTAEEAGQAVQYLQGITIPAGSEQRFSAEVAPVIRETLRGAGSMDTLRSRMAEVFGSRYGMGGSLPVPMGTPRVPTQEWGRAIEAIPTHFGRDFTSGSDMALPPMLGVGNNGAAASPAVVFGRGGASGGTALDSTSNIQTARTDALTFERPPPDSGPSIGGVNGTGDSATVADAVPESPVARRDARNGELERLRKIEANHEKEKAALARQKQPALARSESHDVGHAEGTGNMRTGNAEQFLRELSDRVADRLRRKAGV